MTILPSFYSTDLFWSLLKWLVIFAIGGIFAFLSWKEDKAIRQLLVKNSKDTEILTITAILQSRNWRIWAFLSLLLAAMAANDIHRDKALLAVDFFTPHVIVGETPSAPKEHVETTDDKYDKVLRKNGNTGVPFSNITEFNEQNSKREAYIDWLKERYESWLITYYYLDKCKKTGVNDYETIHNALKKDLDSAHANEAVEGNILLAANGSYKEMYSNIPCDDSHLNASRSMYDANMQQVRSQRTGAPGVPKP